MKPFLTYKVKGQLKYHAFSRYREAKKHVKVYLPLSDDNTVSLIRKRRSEWGQWYEEYTMINKKVVRVKETWL